jgi:hypothetical protein
MVGESETFRDHAPLAQTPINGLPATLQTFGPRHAERPLLQHSCRLFRIVSAVFGGYGGLNGGVWEFSVGLLG